MLNENERGIVRVYISILVGQSMPGGRVPDDWVHMSDSLQPCAICLFVMLGFAGCVFSAVWSWLHWYRWRYFLQFSYDCVVCSSLIGSRVLPSLFYRLCVFAESVHPDGCITSSGDRVKYVLECAASLITAPSPILLWILEAEIRL